MNKKKPPQPFSAYSREIIYSTLKKSDTMDHSIDHVSESAGRILGYEPGYFQDNCNSWISAVHPDYREQLQNNWNKVFQSKKASAFKYRMKRGDSRKYIWMEDRTAPRLDEEGRVVGVIGSAVEVSVRSHRKPSALNHEPGPEEIALIVPIGIVRTDLRGRLIFVNNTFAELLGYASPVEMTGKEMGIPIYGGAGSWEEFRRRFGNIPTIGGVEGQWRRNDGSTLSLRTTVNAARNRKGDITGYDWILESVAGENQSGKNSFQSDRILRMLSTVRQNLLRGSGRDSMLDSVCGAIVEVGGFSMAWIGLVDDTGEKITPLVWSGGAEAYLNGREHNLGASAGGGSLLRDAVLSGKPAVCNDLESDLSAARWGPEALERGVLSVGFFPMHVRDVVVGILSMYSDKRDSFGLERAHLLSELADDIGNALWTIETRTQFEAADEVLRDREFWLNESQRVAQIGSYIYDITSKTWSGSPVLIEILGLGNSYVRDFKSWLRLIHPDDRGALLSGIKSLSPSERKFATEFRVVRASDQSVRWMWGTAEVRNGPDGNPAKLFGTVQDITERKRVEEELQQERLLLRTLVDNLPSSIYAKDKNYRKILANPTNVSHARRTSEIEVVGKTDFDLYPSDIARRFYEDDRRVIELGESVIDREEFTFNERGEKRWQLTSKIPIRGMNGEIEGLIGIGTDISERKLAEEEKQRERMLLRTLLDNLPASIWVKDSRLRRTAVNRAHVLRTRLFSGRENLSDSDFIGRTDFDLYSSEKAEEYSREDRAILRDGNAVLNREELVFDNNGGKHWQLVSKVPLFDEGGGVAGLVGIVTDITKQKETEEAHAQGRQLLKTIIDNIPNAIFVKDKDLRKVIANPSHIRRVERSSGKNIGSESEIVGKTDSEVYPPEMAEAFLIEDEEILRSGTSVVNREYHSVDPDGQERWELISKIPLRDKGGEISGFVGITSEITDQKLSEEALRRERIMLRTIIDHIPNAIFAKDRNFRKILVNPAHVERMNEHFGKLGAEELLGKTDFEVCPNEVAEEYYREDMKVIGQGKTILNKPSSNVDMSGSKRWELVSKIPMRDERGEIIGLVGVSSDITALQEAEDRIAESEARFRLLAENAKDIVFRYAILPAPGFEYVSPSCIGINGYTPEEHYADPELIVSIMHPEDRLTLRELGEKAMDSDSPITCRWVKKDGTVIWVEIQSRAILSRDGETVALEGIVRDVTERRRSEEELRASQETLARITGSINDIIYSVSGTTGEFEYLSPVFEKILGYSCDDIRRIGGRWRFLQSVIENDDLLKQDPVLNELQSTLSGRPPVWERWWKCKDGTKRFFEDNSVPVYEGGRLVRIDGVLRDITERKLAEEEAESERILLRTLIDNFPYAIYVKDRECRKVVANLVDVQQFAGLSSEEEIIGKSDFDIYPRSFAERSYDDDRRVIENGESVLGKEEPVIDAQGNERWLLTTKVPLRGKDGRINGLVGVGIDVTEKRAVAEALKRSEAELRALFESMHDVVMAIDSEGRYLKVAPTDPSLLYKPAEEMTGRTLFEILPNEQAEQFFLVVDDTLQTRRTHTFEYMMNIGGEERWRAASVSPLSETSVIWVARDITDRKTMEKEITDSEKKYRELVENALVGIYKVNLSGTIVYVNKAMADMLEYDSPEELMSVSFSTLYNTIEDMTGLIEELHKFGKTDENKEVELVTRKGKVLNVLLSASLDTDVISGMAKDITDIRTLERQFIQTQKLEGLGNIAAGIAHDFNNILGVILGYSDLLSVTAYEPDKFQRGMQAITKSADRGKSLVRQLLTFARKTEVTFESLTLNDAVMEIERLMRETFPRIIEVRTNLASHLPPVLADATQIHQVLLNICVNARDAMPRGGILSINTDVVPGSMLVDLHHEATSEEYVELRVADTGTGMDVGVRQKLFEPFFTTKGIGKGTGLGLSVVYGIVESHRGFIDVESELGEGATFKIYFPVLTQPMDAVELAKGVPEGASSTGTILVIEDEEMLRELLRSVLTTRGHNLYFAKDGAEGVKLFRENIGRIDVVLTDLGLPRLSGEEVVGSIGDSFDTSKIIVASGFISPEVRSELEKAGVSHFIQKPYRSGEVLRAVNDVLRSGGQ